MIHEIAVLTDNPDESAVLQVVVRRVGLVPRLFVDHRRLVEAWQEGQGFRGVILASRHIDGLALVRRLRELGPGLVVCLVDGPTEEAWVALLEEGADLVVVRPYSARVLMAQLRALLRRQALTFPGGGVTLAVGGLRLDPVHYRVTVEATGETRRLTRLEFRLLYALMSHAGQTLTVEEIVEHVWGYTGQGSRELVRGLIKRLRAKVEPDPAQPMWIQTVPGVGYRFQVPV